MEINKSRVQALKAVMAGMSQKDFANLHGLDASYLSQILNGHRKLGEKAAANLEEKIGLPSGSLVAPPAPAAESASPAPTPGLSAVELLKQSLSKVKGFSTEARQRIVAAAEELDCGEPNIHASNMASLRPRKEEIVIPQYDVRAAMGHGQVPAEYTEVVRNLVVREELLRDKGVTYTSASALAMIVGWGQSMEGTINDKDLVIVDRGVNEYVGEAIYVLTWHGHLFIKRIQILDADRFLLVSDNQNVRDVEARVEDVTIHAKALYIWNGRKA